MEGFHEVDFNKSVSALQLMCGVQDSLAVEVTGISARPQASRGLRMQVEGTLTSFSDHGSGYPVLALLEAPPCIQ